MPHLSQQAFQQAQTYVNTSGRAMDQARLAYHFGEGGADAVLATLTPYQNDDGGFGHAIEPDLRTAASSAIGTQTAFNVLREVNATSDEPLVQRGVNYLFRTLDVAQLRWEIVPPAVEDAPHAPWWTYGESAGSGDGFRSNPRAALIGFLCEHQRLVPAALLAQLISVQIDHLLAQPIDEGVDMHALPCYITLLQSPMLPLQQHDRLLTGLLERVHGTVVTERAKFGEYGLLPLDVAPTPDAPLAATVERSAVDAHLDYLLTTQLPDGSWPLPWSWAFVDKHAWAQAERDWKGKIIVNRLRSLRAWGKIEETVRGIL